MAVAVRAEFDAGAVEQEVVGVALTAGFGVIAVGAERSAALTLFGVLILEGVDRAVGVAGTILE